MNGTPPPPPLPDKVSIASSSTCSSVVSWRTMDDDSASAFKELYEEIDKLCYQSASVSVLEDVKAQNNDSRNSVLMLKNEDVDELIEYSKKFVEKTKNEIGVVDVKHFEEHGVQCVRSEKKSNKKLNTPPKWIAGQNKEAVGTNHSTAIRIIRRIPKAQATEFVQKVKSPSESQLNNQRPPTQPIKVRNVGVNVNFINQKVAKHSNNAALGSPSVVSRTPPVIKKPVTPQSSGRIYRFYSSKLSPTQLWEQQHPELAYESSERSAFPKRIKKSDLIAKQREQPATQEAKELKILRFSEGVGNYTVKEDKEEMKEVEEKPEAPVEELSQPKTTITTHVIPVISIKGDWKANLQVQETCRINILDVKRDENMQTSSNNLKYLEIKHGCKSPVEDADSPEDRLNITKPIEVTKPAKETEFVQIVKVQKPLREALQFSDNPAINRYLQPFVNIQKPQNTSKSEMFIDLSESSSDDSIDGIILGSDSSESCSAENLQSMIRCQPTLKSALEPKKTKEAKTEGVKHKLASIPRLVSPTKSVELQVPSPPCQLRSPQKTTSPTANIDDDLVDEPLADMSHSSKFLDNLRIWKSAIQVQSENMKLGHQLTENLDVLKQNMEVIAEETQNINQITRNCEQNLKQIEGLKDRYSKNLNGCGSTTGSFQHRDQVTVDGGPVADCSCFGCHPLVDTLEREPSFDHKAFQRVVLEQSPRYSKTIQKICEEGRNRSFKKTNVASRKIAEHAAQKFLESCSRSVSRVSSGEVVPLDGNSFRSHSPGSVRSWNGSCYSGSPNSSSNGDVSVTSSWVVGVPHSDDSYTDSDLISSGVADDRNRKEFRNSTSLSGKSSSDGWTRVRKSLSDEGEVLSQGEVR